MTNSKLKALYLRLNRRYFAGRLDKFLNVSFRDMSDYKLGHAAFVYKPGRKAVYHEICLHPELKRRDRGIYAIHTLLHEMAHLSVGHQANHGPRFQKEIRRLFNMGAYVGTL